MISIGSVPLIKLQNSQGNLIIYENFISRINANGGSINQSSIDIIDAFVAGCKSDGIWYGLLDQGLILPFVGNNLAAGITPLCAPVGTKVTSVNFVEGDYSEAAGLNPSSGSRYLNTGVPASIFPNTFCQSWYSRTNSDVASGRDCGAFQALASRCDAGARSNGGVVGFGYNNSVSAVTSDSLGLFSHSRVSSSDLRMFKRISQVGTTNTNPGGTAPTINNYVFAINNNGPAANATGRTISFYMFTPGFTPTQVGFLNTRVEAMQTSYGRNV
jgi:hypothetical protein